MSYRLSIENIEPDHWVAWALELPGCFSSARTQEEAVAQAPVRIADYFAWLSRHGWDEPRARQTIEVHVAEVFRPAVSTGDYWVNAFFDDDRRPLAPADVEHGLRLLGFSRTDLLALTEKLPPARLSQPLPGEAKGSLQGILSHVARAEWWYFDRLGRAFPWTEMPASAAARLEKVRAQTCDTLPKLVDDDQLVVELRGEKWSPRKVLRRTLWHERDHTHHIGKLLGVTA